MPFNPRDPLSVLSPSVRSLLPTGRGSQPASLTDQQERSLVSRIGSALVSPIVAVGSLLDKPGSMLRDVISTVTGNPQNPVDQLLPKNWFNFGGHRFGRDILRDWGMAGQEDTIGNFAGGLAFDILTDPLTFLGGQAFTKAGRSVQNAGLMDDFLLGSAVKQAGEPTRIGPRQIKLTATPADVIAASANPAKAQRRFEQAARTAGHDPAALMGERLASGFRLHVPFTRLEKGFGGGPKSIAVARAVDRTMMHMSRWKISRFGASLFDPELGGQFMKDTPGAVARDANLIHKYNLRQNVQEGARIAEALDHMGRSFHASGLIDPVKHGEQLAIQHGMEISRLMEQPDMIGHIRQQLAGGVTPQGWSPEVINNLDQIERMTKHHHKLMERQLILERKTGLRTPALDDFLEVYGTLDNKTKYIPHIHVRMGGLGSPKPKDPTWGTSNMFAVARKLREITGGKETLIRASMDDLTIPLYDPKTSQFVDTKISGLAHRIARPEDIFQRQPGSNQSPFSLAADALAQYWGPRVRTTGMQVLADNDEAIHSFTNWLMHLDPRHADNKIPALTIDPIDAAARRINHGNSAAIAADGIASMVARQGRVIDDPSLAGPLQLESIGKLLQESGLDVGAAAENVKRHFLTALSRGTPGVVATARELLTKQVPGLGPLIYSGSPSQLVHAIRQGIPAQKLTDLLHVPFDFNKAAKQYIGAFVSPEQLSPFVEFVDWFTRLFKTGVTTPWPAFHVRNLFSAAFNNWLGGAYDPTRRGPWAFIANYHDALGLAQGKASQGLLNIPGFSGLTPEKAAEQVRRLASAHKVISRHTGFIGELEDPAASAMRQVFGTAADPAVLPSQPQSLRQTLWPPHPLTPAPATAGKTQKLLERATRPLRRYTAGMTDIGNAVEQVNRLAPFIAFLKQGMDPAEAARRVKMLQVDYSFLSPFEKQTMRRLVPFYCVPDDHEILSKRGWLKVDDLRVGDQVLTLNHATGASEWQPCLGKSIFDYDGVLMTLSDRSTTFLFTPNHRWPVFTGNRNRRKACCMREGWRLRSGDRIPRTSNFQQTVSIATPREAAVIAWIVTDGYMRCRNGFHEHVIYQSPGKYLDEILALLGEDGTRRKPHPQTGVVAVYIKAGQLKQRIIELLPAKEAFVQFVCGLSREAADACFATMLKAEGSYSGAHHVRRDAYSQFSQNKGPILDAFLILSQLCGVVAHVTCRGATVNYSYHHKKVTGCLGTTWYRGRVWCPQTPNGTWLMRRNGRMIWTGNSFTRRQLPFVVKELMEHPGGKLAQTIKAIGKTHEADVVTPDYVGQSASLPWNLPFGKPPDKTRRYITGLGLMFEDPLQFLGPAMTGQTRDLLLEGASRVNPLLRMPLEWMTGEVFFQRGFGGGRELEDLDPTIARTISNVREIATGQQQREPTRPMARRLWDPIEFVAGGLPISRALTTARQASDPRKQLGIKALNLLTGLRVADVSERAEMATLDERARELLRELGGSVFQKVYIRPERLAAMTPAEREQAIQLEILSRMLDRRRR